VILVTTAIRWDGTASPEPVLLSALEKGDSRKKGKKGDREKGDQGKRGQYSKYLETRNGLVLVPDGGNCRTNVSNDYWRKFVRAFALGQSAVSL
jgi:hypothetical protein